MDDVNWRVGPTYFVLLCSFDRSEGQCLFSMLYRILLFPISFAVVFIFTFIFPKRTCRICVLFSVTTYALTFLRLASRFVHCSRKETSSPLVVLHPYRIVSYCITMRISPSQEADEPLSKLSQCGISIPGVSKWTTCEVYSVVPILS
jgi:hypothetical protein